VVAAVRAREQGRLALTESAKARELNRFLTRMLSSANPSWVNANSAIWFDYDRDGLLDLFIANGHVYPDVARTGTSTFRQRNQLFRNVGRGRYAHGGSRRAGNWCP
jgi:hypothetical protein